MVGGLYPGLYALAGELAEAPPIAPWLEDVFVVGATGRTLRVTATPRIFTVPPAERPLVTPRRGEG